MNDTTQSPAEKLSNEDKRPNYPGSLIVQPPDERLFCAICFELMHDPVQCLNGHTFCKSCILQQIVKSKTCPSCRTSMDESRIAVNLFLRSVIEETKVKCRTLIDPDGLDSTQMPFKRVKTTHEDLDVKIKNEAVCDWTGPLRTAEDHFVQCPFKVVICPNDGCTAQMMRKNITGHEGGCLYRLIPCTFCSERFKFFELDEHRELCPCRVVECPNRCTVDSSEHAELTQVPLDKLDEHKKECLLEIIKCPFFFSRLPS